VKVADTQLELRTLLSLFDGEEPVRAYLRGNLTQEFFGLNTAAEVFGKYRELMTTQSEIPSREAMAAYGDLVATTRDIFASVDQKPFELGDAQLALRKLGLYRDARALMSLSQVVHDTKELSEPTPEWREKVVDVIDQISTKLHAAEVVEPVGVGRPDALRDNLKAIVSLEKPNLIPTGFRDFDQEAGGMSRGELFIPASHAKGGKSTLALSMATNMYLRSNANVLFCTLELSTLMTQQRLMSALSTVEFNKLRQHTFSDAERKRVIKCYRDFYDHGRENGCVFDIDDGRRSVDSYRALLKRKKYDVFVLDYLNLASLDNSKLQGWEKLMEIALRLKVIAAEMNVLVISPTQMNTDGELRYAKGLADHADTVWTWQYGEEEQKVNQIEITQKFTRSWAPFSFKLMTDLERSRVYDCVTTL
jgi:ATP:corrinoid adenosyltransferase